MEKTSPGATRPRSDQGPTKVAQNAVFLAPPPPLRPLFAQNYMRRASGRGGGGSEGGPH